MATGLDVAAGVAGLITLADIVIDRTYRTIKACKNASEDSKRFLRESQALLGVLTGLLKLAEQVNKTSLASHITAETVHDCQQTLTKMRDKLIKAAPDEPGISKMTQVARTLKWPFTGRETEEILEQLHRYKSEFDLSLTMDVLENLLHNESDVRPKINQLVQSVKDLVRISTDQERLSALRFYHTFTPESNHEMNAHLRQAGTGLWLTRGGDFDAWKSNSNSKLWIYGIPGAGKTVCTAALIDEVAQVASADYAFAYFYCDYKSESTLQLQNLLASIAGQLARQHEKCFQKLQSSYRPRPDQPPRHSLPSVNQLTRLIRAMITHFDDVAVVVDGVDECLEPGEVAYNLAELSKSCPKLRMIITSRREQIIECNLSDFTSISIAAQSDDLKLYVSSQLDERTRRGSLRLKSSALKDQILETLVNGADGMFRWVACQIDHLCRLPTDAARRKALGSLPPDLYTTYDRILQRIDQNGSESSELAQKTLRWLYDNSPSITSEQLHEALSISDETLEHGLDVDAFADHATILHLCGSLVREGTGNLKVEYAHFTVKEYLSSDRVRDNQNLCRYFCSERIVNEFKARTCIQYLSLPDFRTHRRSLEWQDCASADPKKPFYAFACIRFPEFYHKIPDDCSACALVSRFFTEMPGNFETWKPNFILQSHFDEQQIILTLESRPSSPYCDSDVGTTDEPSEDEEVSIRRGTRWSAWSSVTEEEVDDIRISLLWLRVLSIAGESDPIHYASMLHWPGLVQLLVSHGADVDTGGALGIPVECALRGSPSWSTMSGDEKTEQLKYFWEDLSRLALECERETLLALTRLGTTPSSSWSSEHVELMMKLAIHKDMEVLLLQLLDDLPGIVLDLLGELLASGNWDYDDYGRRDDLAAAIHFKSVSDCDKDKLEDLVLRLSCYDPQVIDKLSTKGNVDTASKLFDQMMERTFEDDDEDGLRLLVKSTGIDCCQWTFRDGRSTLQMATDLMAPDTFRYLLHHHDSTGCKITHASSGPAAPSVASDTAESNDKGEQSQVPFTGYLWKWTTNTCSRFRSDSFLQVLLEYGADPLRVTSRGTTILCEIIKLNDIDKLKAFTNHVPSAQLSRLMATPFTENGISLLPIELAAENKFYQAFDVLLSTSPDLSGTHQIFRRIIRNVTTSSLSTCASNLEKVKACGGDVICKDKLGRTSLHELLAQLPDLMKGLYSRAAIAALVTSVIDMMQSCGEDPFDPDSTGETPLHALCNLIVSASYEGHHLQHYCTYDQECSSCALYGYLGLFISRKADVRRRQGEGLSALDILFRGTCERSASGSPEVNSVCSRAFYYAATNASVTCGEAGAINGSRGLRLGSLSGTIKTHLLRA